MKETWKDNMLTRIIEEIKSIFERDPAARNAPEIILCYPGFQAVLIYRLTNLMWKAKLKLIARITANIGRIITGIEIHPAAKIGKKLFIDHGIGVVIGETAVIGNGCTLYHGVTLGGVSWEKGKRHPTLGDDVIIGAGAKVLGPITVGNGSKIGSNAVVLENVPSGSTVVGIPARTANDDSVSVDAHDRNTSAFRPYGQTPGLSDPIDETISVLIKKIDSLEKELINIKSTREK